MKTFLIVTILTIVCALMFYVGYLYAGQQFCYRCEKDWDDTIERVRKFASKHPSFIELPTGEILLLRHYPADYVFLWDENLPHDSIVLDTIK